jgi:peptide-methionine (R)-S-oxide reductase
MMKSIPKSTVPIVLLLSFLSLTVLISKVRSAEVKSTGTGMITVLNVEKGALMEVEKIQKSEDEWKKVLTPEQFSILRKHGTDRPFTHPYNDNKKKGVYKCAACGTELFLSDAKFESGTGWPSFFQPVAKENVGTTVDKSFFMTRVEVHCPRCGGHLGHIFDDGPPPTGKRYCINGAALKFEEKEGKK